VVYTISIVKHLLVCLCMKAICFNGVTSNSECTVSVIIYIKTAVSWVAWSISVAPAADTFRPRER